MSVVEEPADKLGRWFARYGVGGQESFSARLLHGTDEVWVAWTDGIRQLVSDVAAIQSISGRDIARISGTASDGIEAIVRSGRFRPEPYRNQLARRLGGKWRIDVARRAEVSNEVWEIVATRLGD